MSKEPTTVNRRTVFRHPLAAVGGALMVAGLFVFVILLILDFTSAADNPYRSIFTFIGAPTIILVGFLLFMLAVRVQVMRARKKGEEVRFSLSVEPTDPNYMRSLWLFLGLSAVLLVIVGWIGYEGYETTESVAFCSDVCHEVMRPQAVTYANSPHARVPCVDCHIGPGASFWVKSKVDGLRQVYASTFNTFERPIPTPVHELRPAQETCEQCHWPKQFYGQKMVEKTYYRTDEENSPWTTKLLVKIGGGDPRQGELAGIHWHMLQANKVEYIAADRKRQNIVWVRQTDQDGNVYIYTDPDADSIPDPDDPNTEVRSFDCMDCHNRPSHKFMPPATSLNLALETRRISPEIPEIRYYGLELLNAEYETTEEALATIASEFRGYYEEEYTDFYAANPAMFDAAEEELQRIYSENFFPEMKTDYRARENNLSHFVNDGCFRCHDGIMATDDGKTIDNDCNTCHLVVAQGPSEDDSLLASNIAGLEFEHPEDIDGMWQEFKCTECHTPEQGY